MLGKVFFFIIVYIMHVVFLEILLVFGSKIKFIKLCVHVCVGVYLQRVYMCSKSKSISKLLV